MWRISSRKKTTVTMAGKASAKSQTGNINAPQVQGREQAEEASPIKGWEVRVDKAKAAKVEARPETTKAHLTRGGEQGRFHDRSSEEKNRESLLSQGFEPTGVSDMVLVPLSAVRRQAQCATTKPSGAGGDQARKWTR